MHCLYVRLELRTQFIKFNEEEGVRKNDNKNQFAEIALSSLIEGEREGGREAKQKKISFIFLCIYFSSDQNTTCFSLCRIPFDGFIALCFKST